MQGKSFTLFAWSELVYFSEDIIPLATSQCLIVTMIYRLKVEISHHCLNYMVFASKLWCWILLRLHVYSLILRYIFVWFTYWVMVPFWFRANGHLHIRSSTVLSRIDELLKCFVVLLVSSLKLQIFQKTVDYPEKRSKEAPWVISWEPNYYIDLLLLLRRFDIWKWVVFLNFLSPFGFCSKHKLFVLVKRTLWKFCRPSLFSLRRIPKTCNTCTIWNDRLQVHSQHCSQLFTLISNNWGPIWDIGTDKNLFSPFCWFETCCRTKRLSLRK